jgi:hypothetical protein
MHECPESGQACYCHGDIDDAVVETWQYSSEHCEHPFSDDCEANWPEYNEDDQRRTQSDHRGGAG